MAPLYVRSLAAVFTVMMLVSPFSVRAQLVPGGDLVTSMANYGLTTFVSLLKLAKVDESLKGIAATGPVTVFAPSEAAFAVLSSAYPAQLACVTTGQGIDNYLSQILKYHILPNGNFTASKLTKLTQVSTLIGLPIQLEYTLPSGPLKLDMTAEVVQADAIFAGNGTVHVIDSVLIPETILPALMDQCGGAAPSSVAPVPGL
ncbi:hypothetical protein CBR_g49930 [Chara braunii]|uniref:FAS1 domain-containing protein n=1 Tax=Chara braunii TaxID=69332 RepID=A0A388JPC0_CHABU|nr:hypothetical protein CBR_g49930 [Chara braunii]|eukprot:GBG59666.1 hypothetical protein CBR_g49930 [Chara braunii]